MATTIEDAVKARYSTQYLIELTNPDDTQPQSTRVIGDARLTAAADDVRGEWLDAVGSAIDETTPVVAANKGQIAAAVVGTIAYLEKRRARTGNDVSRSAWKEWQDALARYVTVAPATDSVLNPSQPIAGSEPSFDDDRMGSYMARDARGGTNPNDPTGNS